MNQQTLSDLEYSARKKKTKREEFLNSMDEIIPWDYWVEIIRPYYPSGKRGRRPKEIETMLRMYLILLVRNARYNFTTKRKEVKRDIGSRMAG